jgi:hypothetical protein
MISSLFLTAVLSSITIPYQTKPADTLDWIGLDWIGLDWGSFLPWSRGATSNWDWERGPWECDWQHKRSVRCLIDSALSLNYWPRPLPTPPKEKQ